MFLESGYPYFGIVDPHLCNATCGWFDPKISAHYAAQQRHIRESHAKTLQIVQKINAPPAVHDNLEYVATQIN